MIREVIDKNQKEEEEEEKKKNDGFSFIHNFIPYIHLLIELI